MKSLAPPVLFFGADAVLVNLINDYSVSGLLFLFVLDPELDSHDYIS